MAPSVRPGTLRDVSGPEVGTEAGDDLDGAPDWWFENVEAPLAAAGIVPPPGWAEAEYESARRIADDFARLGRDLDDHPESPTLTRMAVRDASGAVVGMSYGSSGTEAAWHGGAQAEDIAEADRLATQLDAAGPVGSPAWYRVALRLSWRILAVNKRLRRYSGLRRTFSTAIHAVRPPHRLDPVATLATAAQVLRRRSRCPGSRSTAGRPASPPILEPSTVAPVLRTGPPASRVRVAA